MIRRPTNTRAAAAARSENPSKATATTDKNNTQTALGTRKRAALGDVTNNNKQNNPTQGGVGKDLKKPTTTTTTTTTATTTTAAATRRAPRNKATSTNYSTTAAAGTTTTNSATSALPRPRARGATTTTATTTSSLASKPARPATRRQQQQKQVVGKAPSKTSSVKNPLIENSDLNNDLELDEQPEKPSKRPRTSSDIDEDVVLDKEESNNKSSSFSSDDKQLKQALDDSKVKSSKDKRASSQVQDWEDLDAGEEDDHLMVSSYVVEIYDYLLEIEPKTMPDPEYMKRQEKLSWNMRTILMDWLIEVHSKFRLLPETIFLAANIIDRFLSARAVNIEKFQLVGTVALFIASKYEEIVCPSITNFVHMTGSTYCEDEFIKAERYMLSVIGFDLSYPNPINFLRRISKADNYDIQTRTIAKYLMEISLVERKLLYIKPSLLAAAAMWLARKILKRGRWNPTLVHYSYYTEEEIYPWAQVMFDYICTTEFGNDPVTQLHKKYASKRFYRASEVCANYALNCKKNNFGRPISRNSRK